MSAAVARPTMPNGRLFESPLGLFDFQVDAVAHAYLRTNMVAVIERGLGKTILMMALAAQLVEDDQIDLVLCIARRNKLDKSEFPADWAAFTSLSTLTYLGPGRQAKLAARPDVQVLLTTYETGKLDLMRRVKKSGTRGRGGRADGPLMEALRLRDKRVLWVFDEVIKLGSRRSELYQAYDYVLSQLRKGPHQQRVLGLSATPMSTDYEQSFNIGRIVAPEAMPTVTEFETRFTYGRDDYGRYRYRKQAREEFAPLFQAISYRKRASDADVRDQMPNLTEKLIEVELEPEHRQLYEAVSGLLGPWDTLEDTQRDQLNTALRLTAGYPEAHAHSSSELSRAIVASLGADRLTAVPSSKAKRLLEELDTLGDAQVLIFTFYAELILPLLARDIQASGRTVACYHGGQSGPVNEAAKQAFKSGQAQVLLSSDAGAEGLNLPEARYVIEYESAKTFDKRMQRFGRATRITGGTDPVYGLTLVAKGTREQSTIATVLRRNEAQDTLLGDTGADGYVDARVRKVMLGR